jgi:hypothetical protein
MTQPGIVVESKLKTGTLKFGPSGAQVEFACQATNVTISSTYTEDGEPVEVLCGTNLPAPTTVQKVLKITAIQDFDDPDGFMRYIRQRELTEVDFSWQASPAAEIASGKVQARLGDWGGDVNKRLTTAPEMPIVTLTWTPPAPLATQAAAGVPGDWYPPGAQAPLSWSALLTSGIEPIPPAPWAPYTYVTLADGSPVYWTGEEWAIGPAPGLARGATYGFPGQWTPAGSFPPQDLDALMIADITPSPVGPWPTGSWVELGDGTEVSWDVDARSWLPGTAR